MAEYLAPGVYVEEFDSGAKAMEGVSTSTAGFIGLSQRGPTIAKPILVTSFAEFQRMFGTYLSSAYKEQRYLAYSVEQFFNNGGSSAYIMRVAGTEDTCAVCDIEGDVGIHVEAANVGAWGNQLQVRIRRNYEKNTIILEDGPTEHSYLVKNASVFQVGELVEVSDGEGTYAFYTIMAIQDQCITLDTSIEGEYKADGPLSKYKLYAVQYDVWAGFDGVVESYLGVSMQKNMPNGWDRVLVKSQLIKVTFSDTEASKEAYQELDKVICEQKEYIVNFSQGVTNQIEDDPSLFLGEDKGPGKRSGLAAFQEISDVSIMCIPGITNPQVQSALVAFCEGKSSCVAILDIPITSTSVDELLTHRSYFDSSYGAIYHPWLGYFDVLEKRNFFLPPSGVMAGVYARCDTSRGVHKAPANETIRGCTSLSITYNEAEQAKLNPKGVNLIRSIPGNGIRVWGARTMSSDSSWKYINVRRLFIYIEESIRANTNWAVFEPNDEILWSRVQGTITMFLTTLWRDGALAGSTPDEAFFVNIGKSTMTQDDILNGRLICVIGAAPVRPAEFVIFRITQKMEDAS